MTIDEVKEAVSCVLNERISTQLYLILKDDQSFTLRIADVMAGETTQEIQKMFKDFLNSNIIENDNLVVKNLSTADESPDAIYQYDYDSYPEELELFHQFKIEDAINSDHFNFQTDSLNQLFGYILYLGTMDKGLLLFKKHYPISLIKRNSFLLGAIKSKERFEKLPGEDIIRLNGSAQLLRLGDTIFVLDLNMLEHSMGFSALIQRAASEAIDAIEELEILDDIEVLRETLEEPSFARKLSKIKKSSPIFTLGIPKDDIIKFITDTPALKDQFKYNADYSKIVLTSKKSKQAFLKLMNDSFLHSKLTKQDYEASAKDNITRAIP